MDNKKIMGRPTVPDYAKKQYRFSGIEKRFLAVIENMVNEHDKKLVLSVLEDMKKTR